eukprot:TCALIF_11294-PA protein Name:"Protein of unknown function" AED:0.24 eAED:0.24 QI:53/0.5/0.33/0.66/1/0.66/3/0/310
MCQIEVWNFRPRSWRECIKRSWAPLVQYRISSLLPAINPDLEHSHSDDVNSPEKDQAVVKDGANLMHIWASTMKTLEWVETLYLETKVSETYQTLLKVLQDHLNIPASKDADLMKLLHQSVAILNEFFENNESTKFLKNGLNQWNWLDMSEEFRNRPLRWRVEFLRHIKPNLRSDNDLMSSVPSDPSSEVVESGSQVQEEVEIVETFPANARRDGSENLKEQTKGGFQLMLTYMARKLISSKLCQEEEEAQRKALHHIKSLEAAGFNYRKLLRFYYKEKQRLENDHRGQELKPILFKTIASKNRGIASME